MDISLNGRKPPDEIKVKAKLKESKVLKPIISQVIKIFWLYMEEANIIDEHKVFKNQAKKRLVYYHKQN